MTLNPTLAFPLRSTAEHSPPFEALPVGVFSHIYGSWEELGGYSTGV